MLLFCIIHQYPPFFVSIACAEAAFFFNWNFQYRSSVRVYYRKIQDLGSHYSLVTWPFNYPSQFSSWENQFEAIFLCNFCLLVFDSTFSDPDLYPQISFNTSNSLFYVLPSPFQSFMSLLDLTITDLGIMKLFILFLFNYLIFVPPHIGCIPSRIALIESASSFLCAISPIHSNVIWFRCCDSEFIPSGLTSVPPVSSVLFFILLIFYSIQLWIGIPRHRPQTNFSSITWWHWTSNQTYFIP